MKVINFIFFFYIIIFTSNAFSQNIAVINLNKIIDNNNSYNKILKDIELNQEKYLKNFEIKENDLKIQLEEIEDTKLILSEEEINLRIDNYNNQLSEFTILIDKFNVHYQNQIIYIRENILNEIIKLLVISSEVDEIR